LHLMVSKVLETQDTIFILLPITWLFPTFRLIQENEAWNNAPNTEIKHTLLNVWKRLACLKADTAAGPSCIMWGRFYMQFICILIRFIRWTRYNLKISIYYIFHFVTGIFIFPRRYTYTYKPVRAINWSTD